LMLHGVIGRAAGLAMMAALCGYIYLQYKIVKAGEVPPDDLENPAFPSQAAAYGFLLIGLVAVAAGAEFLVRGAKVGAEVIGVPDAVIALSVIALGTSLPELTTCLIAARKKHHEIVFGNIIGSNVFNILMILGATALIRPVAVRDAAQQLVSFDMWVMLAVSLIFAGLVVFGNGIGRRTGALFIGAYFVYNIYIYAIYIT